MNSGAPRAPWAPRDDLSSLLEMSDEHIAQLRAGRVI
jgi:hypothetical protein